MSELSDQIRRMFNEARTSARDSYFGSPHFIRARDDERQSLDQHQRRDIIQPHPESGIRPRRPLQVNTRKPAVNVTTSTSTDLLN